MSKYVKNLICEHLRQRLQGVDGALLVNMIGLDANTSHRLRGELRKKNIQVMVVKNSLAARAMAGTPLAPMFEGLTGPSAICWGSDGMVTLAREVTKLAKDEKLAPFAIRGGVMDGERLTPEQVEAVSKMPARQELIGMLAAQLTSTAGRLAAMMNWATGSLLSQIKQLADQRGDSQSS